MNDKKIIFHIDLNSFFATCAMIKEPFLKDKVFVVGGRPNSMKSVISASSYNARRYGINSGMGAGEALRKFPKLLIVPLDFSLYNKYSKIFFKYLKKYSKLILKGSIDEAYIDMTKYCINRNPQEVGYKIQRELYKEYQLPVSIGISHTLFLAKMGSDIQKPLGITYIREEDISKYLYPLDVGDIFGLGRKTKPSLVSKNILTISDFVKKENKSKILDIMSVDRYNHFIKELEGRGSDIVNPNKYLIPSSISKETTLNYPTDSLSILKNELIRLFDIVYNELINNKYYAKTINIKIRYENRKTITRSKSIDNHSNTKDEFFDILEDLFDKNYNLTPATLIGCGLANIITNDKFVSKISIFD